MNNPSEKLKPLAIDLDQWRRDIETFASTTRQALDGIVSELSNQCTNDFDKTKLKRSLDSSRVSNASRLSNAQKTISKPLTADNDRKLVDQTSESKEGRLANLKLRLAQRIAKNG